MVLFILKDSKNKPLIKGSHSNVSTIWCIHLKLNRSIDNTLQTTDTILLTYKTADYDYIK